MASSSADSNGSERFVRLWRKSVKLVKSIFSAIAEEEMRIQHQELREGVAETGDAGMGVSASRASHD